MPQSRRRKNYRCPQSWNIAYYTKLVVFALVLLALGATVGWFGHAYHNYLQKQQVTILTRTQFEAEIAPKLGTPLQRLHGSGMAWQQYPGTDITVYSNADSRQLVLVSWSNDRQRYTVMYLPFSYKEYDQMFTAR